MKKSYLFLVMLLLGFVCGICVRAECKINVPLPKGKFIVAYGHATNNVDPTRITHLILSFARVNNQHNGVRYSNNGLQDRIVQWKKINPSFKVLVAIGGWGAGGFSEMARDENLRLAFAKDCKRLIDEFTLDGVDLDWEYPTRCDTGIGCHEDDTKNFTLLMRDIREAIGNDKLLTLASAANALYVNFKEVDQYVDFINIMTYDIGNPPYHNAGLFKSPMVRWESCEIAVNLHIAAGISPDKLTMGIPFYGRQLQSLIPTGTDNFVEYRAILRDWLSNPKYERRWDDVAKVPYLVEAETGRYVLSYEDVESIAEKCRFIRQRGLLGAMYWHLIYEDSPFPLRNAVYKGMYDD